MPYPGGKGGDGVYQRIINECPPHETYIEPFAGGASIMCHKRPSRSSIAIDLDASCAQHVADVPGARFVHGCGLQFLRDYRYTGRELVYCDPPYLWSTRKSQARIYRHEMGDLDHVVLLELIRQLPCMVMISGYASDLYNDRLRDWRVIQYRAVTRSSAVAVEWLWMNFPEPVALHDYSYVGADYRERERIKRKARRWQTSLALMPPLEARAVLSACLQAAAPSAAAVTDSEIAA